MYGSDFISYTYVRFAGTVWLFTPFALAVDTVGQLRKKSSK
jgi:hypothetical protein